MLDHVTGIAYLLVILSVLVIVHEWGHFIVAKLCGMRVEEFSLFFGKRLLRLGQRGDTEYNIRAIPLGGFVRIAGMDTDDISGGRPILEALRHPRFDEADAMGKVIEQIDNDTGAGIDAANVSPSVREMIRSAIAPDGRLTPDGREDLEMKQTSPQVNDDETKLIQMVLTADYRASDPGLYSQKPLYQRALTIFAGPFMSLFFGYFLFCVMGMTIGLPGDQITNQVQVLPDGKARLAGMKTGDVIVAIDGIPTPDGKALTEKIHKSANIPLHLTIQRGQQTVALTVTPKPTQQAKLDEKGKPVLNAKGKPVMVTQGVIGIMPNWVFVRQSPVKSVVEGTAMTKGYVLGLLSVLSSRKGIQENVGGPIAMAQAATALQKLGFEHLIIMAAAFSLSLGIMNLLPVPAILDGGHLLLLLVEKVRRRKLTPREVYRAQIVGLAMLAMLVGFVMINDLTRTFTGHGFQ